MSKDKIHTTNYFDTFIEVAEDTNVSCGTTPMSKRDNTTVAKLQFALLKNNPYQYTSDELFFLIFATRHNLSEAEYQEAKRVFFSKGQPCFRSSPLTKTYGFGVHSDSHGKVAIYGMETDQYHLFLSDPSIKKVKAMRTSKK